MGWVIRAYCANQPNFEHYRSNPMGANEFVGAAPRFPPRSARPWFFSVRRPLNVCVRRWGVSTRHWQLGAIPILNRFCVLQMRVRPRNWFWMFGSAENSRSGRFWLARVYAKGRLRVTELYALFAEFGHWLKRTIRHAISPIGTLNRISTE